MSDLLAALAEHGHLVPTGVPGVLGRGRDFELVIDRFERLLAEISRDDGARVLRFPPLIPRRHLERSGFLTSFPHLAASIVAFDGATDLVLSPAACYPIYPSCAGALPESGRLFDVSSWCFRREPSPDPARMQIFRMRELVRLGSAGEVRAFRDLWIQRARALFHRLGLPAEPAPANDPFFGRGGRVLASSQREQGLKVELLLPLTSPEAPTALASFNCHQDHFGRIFDIRTSDGAVAHTACAGFGLERVALALFKTHGPDITRWPENVRAQVGP